MIATSRLLPSLFLLIAASLSSMASATVDIIFQDGFQIHYGFQVQTPGITVPAGQAATYCYFFDASNTSPLGIRRWVSSMQPGMMHLILYLTTVERQPAGTLSQTPCDFIGAGGDIATLAYTAYEESEDLVFPNDDGTGNPLAIPIVAGQSAFLQMYVLNSSNQSFTTSALLSAEALDPATTYTKTSTYVTYNGSIMVPQDAVHNEATQTCSVPANAKFWWLSTRTHKFASAASILDGLNNIVMSTDSTHPSIAQFSAPNFFGFSSGHLTYQCFYDNTGELHNSVITSGYSETVNENCVGIGYFFPKSQGSFCYNNILLQ